MAYTLSKSVEFLTNIPAYRLASKADCARPDSSESAGAQFLERVRDAVVESLEYNSDRDNDLDDEAFQVADDAVLVYTNTIWATFVDLGAYSEDVSELGWEFDPSNTDSYAMIALYMVAARLASALFQMDLDAFEADENLS